MNGAYSCYLSEEAWERLSEVVSYLEEQLDCQMDPNHVLSTIVMQVVMPGECL